MTHTEVATVPSALSELWLHEDFAEWFLLSPRHRVVYPHVYFLMGRYLILGLCLYSLLLYLFCLYKWGFDVENSTYLPLVINEDPLPPQNATDERETASDLARSAAFDLELLLLQRFYISDFASMADRIVKIRGAG